ncbi:MAG: alpha/beta hydrolase [Oligoflexia bacterium]|nr:alpha/beta hydrolase [Oligoflexia bacterium]
MKVFVLLLAVFFANTVHANDEGFVRLYAEGKSYSIYFDYKKADSYREPTVVLLNGLTYSTKSWDAFVENLKQKSPNAGILRFDMVGMGETLLKGKLPVNYEIPYSLQVEITKRLMDHLRIQKAHILGLSYGGAIAVEFAHQHPRKVESLILMAPFTKPLEAQDQWIRQQIALNRITNPWNRATDDELYDYFLRQFIYNTYPLAEPEILKNPYKLEAVFRMVQGIRKYDIQPALEKLQTRKVHLMIANQDQYIPGKVLDNFWEQIPRSARASRIDISTSEHKIPEAIPSFSSGWVKLIMDEDRNLSRGLEFIGNTATKKAKARFLEIQIP